MQLILLQEQKELCPSQFSARAQGGTNILAVNGKDKNPSSRKLKRKIIALLSIACFVVSRCSVAVSLLLPFVEDQSRIMVGLKTVFKNCPG
jgi:hypothetical protein